MDIVWGYHTPENPHMSPTKVSFLNLTLELRTFLYTFVYGGVVFDTDARNVKHKL